MKELEDRIKILEKEIENLKKQIYILKDEKQFLRNKRYSSIVYEAIHNMELNESEI